MNLEHPAQILTPEEWRRRRQIDSAGGTPEAPTTLYLMPGGTTLGPALILPGWSTEKQLELGRMARAIIRGDESHRNGCASGAFRTWERQTCGTCAALGLKQSDEHDPTMAPSYAGWARVYVQAREPIPRAWLPAFVAELNDEENTSYREALRRDVATFGYRITDERPGYRLPTPTPEKLLAWLVDYHGVDQDAEPIREALKEIMRDDDYDKPSQRAAFRAFNRLLHPTTNS